MVQINLKISNRYLYKIYIFLYYKIKFKYFYQIVIRHIHIDRVSAEIAGPGELICLNIKPVKANDKLNRGDFRKGIMMTDIGIKTDLIWEFNCEVKILHHATTIKANYESVVHCGIIRYIIIKNYIYFINNIKN